MRGFSSDTPVDDRGDEFVPSPRQNLYDLVSLLGEWRDDDPASYRLTLDARAYREYSNSGHRGQTSDHTSELRALHDASISRALARRLEHRTAVAVMGGHDMRRDSDHYVKVARLAKVLAENDFFLLSGGGPGAMEATHLGAQLAHQPAPAFAAALRTMNSDSDSLAFPFRSSDELMTDGQFDHAALARLHRWQAPAFAVARSGTPGADSVGIPTWRYGHEPPTPLATEHAKYFENSIREDGLLAAATYGVIFAPGRAGTLQEIFQDAAQNYYTLYENEFSPMIFLDWDEHWTVTYPVRAVLEALMPAPQKSILHFVESEQEAVDLLLQYRDAHPR